MRRELVVAASRDEELEGEEGRNGDGVEGLDMRENIMAVHNIFVHTFDAGYKSLQANLMSRTSVPQDQEILLFEFYFPFSLFNLGPVPLVA